MAGIEQRQVENDESGMRLDRWFKVHYPGSASARSKLLRSGPVRVDGRSRRATRASRRDR